MTTKTEIAVESSAAADSETLRLEDFSYPYPERLVAQEPREHRDQSRLLIRAQNGVLKDSHVTDLTTELAAGTLLILNDTRVFPSRLLGHLPTGGAVELFLLEPVLGDSDSASKWKALGRPMKKLKIGAEIILSGSSAHSALKAKVTCKTSDGGGNAFVELTFDASSTALAAWLDQYGFVPLPPYIKRPEAKPAGVSGETARYQTVYAQSTGSVAAPTAGLHFTQDLLANLRRKDVEIEFVSLHVGAGTFLPVKVDQVEDHKMHAERYRVGKTTASALAKANQEGRPVVAVGTTTLRSLESLYRYAAGDLAAFVAASEEWRTTELFIHPRTAKDRFRPQIIDGLLTNFHQPCSTLFMLISALLGLDEAKDMYQAAIERDYMLYSYGDCSLLWL